jgi:Zn-dependent protease
MDYGSSWSLSLGRWVGVPVRVHALFLLFLAVIFCVDFNSPSTSSNGILATAIATAGILIVSVVLHELAHIFAIHNLGGHVNSVMFMPWGGNSDFDYPTQSSAKLISSLAGPFVNFAVFMFGAVLLLQSTEISFREIIHPFRTHSFHTSDVPSSLIMIGTWVNFQLFVANLIPCFPFDGANVLRTLFGLFYSAVPQYRIESAIRVTGTAVAFTLVGFAWVLRDYQAGPVEPIWFVLLVMGICLYFAAAYSFDRETEEDVTDWDEAHTALGLSDSFVESPSFFVFGDSDDPEYSKWLVEKQEARMRDEMMREQREIELADEVLEKLHQSGIESLTSDEKLLLQRVSERLRRKRKLDVLD